MQNNTSILTDVFELSPQDKIVRDHFTKKYNLHPIASLVLISRGFREEEDVEKFLFGNLSHLPNPFDLSGMKEGVARVIEAIKKKEKILLFGDYDVDGITGSTQLYLFLREIWASVEVLLPHRIEDGYGLSASSVEKIKSRHPQLLITIDNGTKSKEAISSLKESHIETIVIDHHETPHVDHFPPVVSLINPKAAGQKFAEKNLASAGLVFLFLIALRSQLRENNFPQLPNLKRYLDLACLGTIADVVPLTGSNRLIVKYGLEELTHSQRLGIIALKANASIQEAVTPYSVGFRLAPRINAAGRMGHPSEALQLLASQSDSEARHFAQILEDHNRSRQLEEEKALHEAIRMIEEEGLVEQNRKSIVVGSKSWHLGIVGIIAARLAEKYYRPSIALSFFEDKNIAKGSARSIPHFSVHDALKKIEPMMLSFGGHDAAAGMSLKLDSLKEFSRSFEKSISQSHSDPFQKKIRIDAAINFNEISPMLLEQLNLFAPFGAGNPEPVFLTSEVTLSRCSLIGANQAHLKFIANNTGVAFDSIYFNGALEFEQLLNRPRHQIAYYLQNNSWNGKTTIQLKIKNFIPYKTQPSGAAMCF